MSGSRTYEKTNYGRSCEDARAEMILQSYLRNTARPSTTEDFKEGETGALPRNTSKRANVTFCDSIVATASDVNPSDETATCNQPSSKH